MTANDELQQRVVRYLRDRNRGALMRVRVTADNGTVSLRGTLDSFYEKQLCLNACQRVAGVTRIEDKLSVAGAL